MTFFDGFHTGKVITVFIKGEQFFCEKYKKSMIIFRLSPQKKQHQIWRKLEEIELDKEFCTK